MRPQFTLPDIAHSRARGETAVRVHCAANLVCVHSAVKAFEELNLPDEMIFIHVPRYRKFICSKCGSRKEVVRPIFPPAFGTPDYGR
jgi:hypothetical protein